MSPSRPQRPNTSNSEEKPYVIVPFSKQRPSLDTPKYHGHEKYHEQQKRRSGRLHLKLIVKNAVHISTGVMVLGEDIEQPQYDILKTMLRGNDQHLLLPGSSLKGVVRSVHEAITNSTLGVITPFARREKWIPQHRSLNPNKVHQLCLSSRLFGAMNWQGVLHFQDARCQTNEFRVQCLPSLYAPQEKKFYEEKRRKDLNEDYFDMSSRQVQGRKFYYHFSHPISRAEKGVLAQQALAEYVFTTQIHYHSLTPAELGSVFAALGLDRKHGFYLKVGAGKPIGLGTVEVQITEIEQPESMGDRYRSYDAESPGITGDALTQLIETSLAEAHRQHLIDSQQLQQISEILSYPSQRQPKLEY
jgi:hypothetical protein